MASAKDFKYEYALVCRNLPGTLDNGLSLEKHEPIEIAKAIEEHDEYLAYLKESGLKLIEIEAQDAYPDCVFVEDAAIAVDNKILITNPGAETRRGEVDVVSAKFKEVSAQLGLEIVEIKNKAEAFVDGGDVCFTGREILVGVSTRTNLKAIEEIAEVFRPIPVVACNVKEGLHLKSSMTMLSHDTILIGSSDASKSVRKEIEEKSAFADKYRFVEIDEDLNGSANVLLFNGNLVFSSSFEHLYEKIADFQNAPVTKSLANKQFKKIDGCLTCRSVFFNRGN